jgi:hypothetical protein
VYTFTHFYVREGAYLEKYKIDWKQKGKQGTLDFKWWIENGKVKVQLDGDIPDVIEFKGKAPSREASKGALELLYEVGIREQLKMKNM